MSDETKVGVGIYLWGVAAFASMGGTLPQKLFAFLWPVIPVIQFLRRVFA